MKTWRASAAVGCGVALLLAVGCRPGAKDMQMQQLQEENNRLQQDKANLLAQLRQCQSERDQLRSQLADLMGKGPASTKGPWNIRENIAWQDIAENILFDSGKADLKGAGRSTLEQVVADIQRDWPEREVWIIGHTDTDPIKHSKWKDNLELSTERGCTVFREMQRMGMNPARLVAAGQGEFSPKASNDTKANKQLNRRVSIVAVQLPQRNAPAETPGEQG